VNGTAMDEARAALRSRPDGELLRLARGANGDAAFRELYGRHRAPVLGFLGRLLRDSAAAEDALQESFLRVHQHLDQHDPSRSFRPWLFQIARNVGLNALRSSGQPVRQTSGDGARAATSDRVPREAALRESTGEARDALDALPDEMRALLIQRHGLGMSLDELASSWDLNERTIRTRLQAAVDRLTQALLARRAGGVA
jgi:RNA polymerase sigma-70 factor (ECF subfamily)